MAIACDTDGIDGTEDNAGRDRRPRLARARRALGLRAKDFLADNDGYTFFEQLGDLVVTGTTADQRQRLPRNLGSIGTC